MLPSQIYSTPWEVDVDLSIGEIKASRRKSSGLPKGPLGYSETAIREEEAHLRSFGVSQRDRIAEFVGLKFEAYEQRCTRDLHHTT